MNYLIRNFFRNAVGIIVLLFILSPVSGMGADAPFMVAKLTPDTPQRVDHYTVFDKNQPGMRAVIAVQNRHTRELLALPEVVGTAAGLSDSGEPAMLVFTRKVIPPGLIPASIEGIPTIIRVTGEITALPRKNTQASSFSNTAVLTPPVPIGVSTGNSGECSAGTIGARVVSGPNVYALSNNHVYALENDAKIGSEVLQPGFYDTQCMDQGNNHIGTLAAFVQIKFNNNACDPELNATACNTVDAAIAATSDAMLGNSTPPGGYGIPNSKTYHQATGQDPYIGQAVRKYGRTTALTTGTIAALNATVNVSYGTGKNAIFTGQIVITSGKPFSKAGDSGSLIVTADSNDYPVGLLFAGSTKTTIANPIDLVLDSFNVSIDGSGQ